MRQITANDLEYLSVGAAILGTGGGGDPFIGKLMAQQAIEEYGPVTLIDADDLADDDLVAPVGMMGAPTVMIEKIPEGGEVARLLKAVEKRLGRKVTATTPTECGGVNSMIPFLLAAQAGIPLLDGDGMGRAFPELQMETFHVYGVSGFPATIADERGAIVTIEPVDNYQLEWLARGVTIRMGGHAAIADYIMSGADYKRSAVRGTVSMGIEIGRAVMEAHTHGIHPIEALCASTQDRLYGRGIVLFTGKVADVVRRTQEGFARGQAIIQGSGAFQESQMIIEFQNENLVALLDGEAVATVPDLICVLDSEVATAVTTERLRYGQRVTVIGIPTPEIMRSPEALHVWGPQAFGYDVPFTPLETRFSDYYRRYSILPEKAKYLQG